jgi:serine/threonine-protein kinase
MHAADRAAPALAHVTSHGRDHGTCPTPATIGAYRIDALLGSGGYGVVYRARTPDGLAVALKQLHAELLTHGEAVGRFEREVSALSRIRHRGVLPLLDVDVGDDGVPFFTMPLLDGCDLRRHLARRGRLAPEEALRVLRPVAAALGAAHEQGIVHRDVKPSNVFLEAERVVLLDFGIAKLLDDAGPALTRSRMVIGSPSCLAPEQILGEPVDVRTDVYGLGVLAFQILAGVAPFVHERAAVLRELHVGAAPPPLSSRAPVPPEVDAVIDRALAKEPGRRQPSVAALVEELAAALRATPAVASPSEQAMAVHLDSRDDTLLDELVATLGAMGLDVVFSAGNAVTLLLPLAAGPETSRAQRRTVVERLEALCSGRDISVHVNAGSPTNLLRLGSWVPEETISGLVVLPPVLVGLEASVILEDACS